MGVRGELIIIAKAFDGGRFRVIGVDVSSGALVRLTDERGLPLDRARLMYRSGGDMRELDVVSCETEPAAAGPHCVESERLSGRPTFMRRATGREAAARLKQPGHKYLFYNDRQAVGEEELAGVPKKYYYSLLVIPALGALISADGFLSVEYGGVLYSDIRVASRDAAGYARDYCELTDEPFAAVPSGALLTLAVAEEPTEGEYEKLLLSIVT